MAPFSFHSRIQSFRYAISGIVSFFKAQHNAIIHLLATVFVIGLALFFGISVNEWFAIILTVGFVWVAEIFNTAIEAIMDHLSPAIHPKVKYIKDVAAAAVLFAAMVAIVIGLIIFLPKIL